MPEVVFVIVTVPVYKPFASALAAAFSEAVRVVVALTASDPPAEESVSHAASLAAVQLREAVPLFLSVNGVEVTLNGPPASPREVKPAAGETPSVSGKS